MQTRVNYTLVGVFFVGLFLAIVAAIVWLSASSGKAAYRTYAVYMREAVSGLNVQAPVKFNGVKVGEVREINLDYRDLQTVRLLLNIEESVPITEAVRATLLTQGITGITYIGLKATQLNAPLLKVKPGNRYAVIRSSPSLLVSIDTLIREVETSVKVLTITLNEVFNAENKQLFTENLRHLEKFTKALANNSQHLDHIAVNTQQLTQQLTSMMQELSSQTMPNITLISQRLSSVLGDLEQLGGELKRHPSMLIRDKQPLPLGPGE